MSCLRKVEMSPFLLGGRKEDGVTYEPEGAEPDSSIGRSCCRSSEVVGGGGGIASQYSAVAEDSHEIPDRW